MRLRFIFNVCLICCVIVCRQVNAQSYMTDSAFYRQSVDNTINFYISSLGESTHLYNGAEYSYSYHGVTGHPFFETDQRVKGNVFYDGTLYTDIPISYDLTRDEVLMDNKAQGFDLRLVTDKIKSFTILNHVFVRLVRDTINKGGIEATGFYDLLFNGRIKVLAKRRKKIEQAFKAEEAPRFIQYNEYFVLKNDEYHKVDSKRSLLDVFGDQKDKLKKYLKKNKLNYKKNPENTIVKAADYYGQLNN